jgi:hypothetical protein
MYLSPAQCLLSVRCTVEVVLSLLGVGSIPADRRRGHVDLLCYSFRAHCSSARHSPPAADHNYPLLAPAAL